MVLHHLFHLQVNLQLVERKKRHLLDQTLTTLKALQEIVGIARDRGLFMLHHLINLVIMNVETLCKNTQVPKDLP